MYHSAVTVPVYSPVPERVSRIKECFQSNANSFRTEYSKSTEKDWSGWNNHLRLAYRDICVFADAIFDALISTKEEIFDIEAINDKTNILKALQEHYADNNTE